MMYRFFMSAFLVCFSFNAVAVRGSSTSAIASLETVSPSLQSVSASTESSLSATFSEGMLMPEVMTPGNYAVSGLGVGSLVPSPTGVSGGPSAYLLDWASGEMRDGVSLTLTAQGVQDTVGNPINPAANSASCSGMGTPPVFSDLSVMPSKASAGEIVSISFVVSEPLSESPEVTVNGHAAGKPIGKAEGYIFEYEVQEDDPLGMAFIELSGPDLAGNVGMLSDSALLEIVEAEPGLPLWGWPLAAMLLLALGLVFLIRRGNAGVWTGWTKWTGGHHRRGMFFLFVVLSLACSSAFAQTPTVSNVTMIQSPNATSTQVDIYYDLDAPNGPCAITVSLSKDGGEDGYSFPVTSVTGDLADVTTGTGKHIVWDIRADYPEEDLPNARILVTADDGVVEPEVESFTINGGAATTAGPVVTLNNTATNSPTEYMASEASDFSGATWLPYVTAPTFTLSSAEGGTKTVYFKVRNAAGESASVSDTIDLTGQTIALPGDVPLELVWVPGGTFMMGRYPGEADSYDSEDPQHPVTLVCGFWMGKYEITQQQWLAVQGSWPGTTPSASNGIGDGYPAYYISWNDAKEFITTLNGHIVSSGQGPLAVRLPSEAEWEYACRAGTSTRFYFGDSLGCTVDCTDCAAGTLPGNRTDYMWYCGNVSPVGSKPVGGKLPNAFGLYDMSGNIIEWCEDDWHNDYTGAPADGSAWMDAPRASDRIFRGGDWGTYAQWCRSADRNGSAPEYRDYSVGFRLAAVMPPEVTSFAINGGTAITMDPVVTLDNTAMNGPTEYMASEFSDFSGATWQPYDTAPTFSLSFGVGTRTVYFKVRNACHEVSNVVSDTIFLAPNTVYVETGMFTMGRTTSGDDAAYGMPDEDPQHEVMLGTYQIGKGEVTNKEYCDVLNWALAQGYLYADAAGTPWAGSNYIYAGGTAASRYQAVYLFASNIQYSGGVFTSKAHVGLPGTTNYSMDTHPMVEVSWYGSAAFCNWLSEMQGVTPCYDMNSPEWPLTVAPPTPGGYRLPTEAEWERAAAWDGSKHWIYSFISDTLTGKDRANYRDNAPGFVNPLGLTTQPFTSPVMWFDGVNVSPNGSVATINSPSPVGAYDMSGNVIEWCHDWYSLTYYSGGTMTNPTGPATGTNRIQRGGTWIFSSVGLRSARRNNANPLSTGGISLGFRLARSEPSVGTTSLAINNGDATTMLPTVTLNNTCWGVPTEYMASEASDFSGATWQPYDTAPTFTLSSAEGGTKTVYFKVRNAEYESAPFTDTIDLPWRTITLPGDIPLELVWVPSGSYQMGRYPGEADSFDWEDPQHPVTLSKGFWMGKYEITQRQWLAVRGAWPGETPWSGVGDTYPAYNISWYDARNFVTSLNAHIVSSGQGPLTVRLPSEAEWEYACRAGTTTRFYFGDSLGCDGYCTDCAADTLPGNRTDYLWYCGNSFPGGVKPVGGKLPNALGLYDMHGNIHEWCEDDSHYDYIGAPSDGSAWVESPRTEYRMLKGGSYSDAIMYCRAACRSHYPADIREPYIGFRLAAVPTQVVSFAINGGAATTADPAVTLNNTATSSPTEYMASESSDFSGATWQPYDTAPTFTLSSAEGGTKTVYFKVCNAGGESATVSDTIDLRGRTITLPGEVPLELVWVHSGSFQMGRYPGEADSSDIEDPQHLVTLAYGFWMGKYEITQQQWLAVRGSWPGLAPFATYGLGDRYPAYFVSWNDARNFITTLNAHIVSTGQGPLTVRLPSEAEWEYACRAGTTTRFYWGDDLTYTEFGTYAWYSGNNTPGGTKPVGGKLPNLFGLYDMSGNVSEWCEDDVHSNYIGAPVDGSAWIDSPPTDTKFYRGGGYNGLSGCRSASRSGGMVGARGSFLGFRLAALPTKVLSFAINGGAATTTELLVTLNNTATNSPTEYMASEAPDFNGATWQPYGKAPNFTLSLGVGPRTVYFKVRGTDGQESEVASDTIFVTPNTVSVGAGTFTMGRLDSGTNDDVTYGAAYEIPRHEVTFGAYQLGKYEVTVKEYCDVVNWAKAKGYLYADAAGTPWSPSSTTIYAGGTSTSRYAIMTIGMNTEYSGGVFRPVMRVGLPDTTYYALDTHPMFYVTWYGAVAFCNWLSEWQGLTPCYDMNSPNWPLTVAPPTPGGYRLPTEAEWERAAGWDSAGGGRHWIYGFLSDTLTGKDRANYNDGNPNYVNPLGLTTNPRTSPVGWFNGVNVSPNGNVATVDSPSPVGAYDMSGNVQEWCHDWYADNYSDGPMTDPTGPATGTLRINRGGNWFNPLNWCRSACRVSNPPTNMTPSLGFRLAKSE